MIAGFHIIFSELIIRLDLYIYIYAQLALTGEVVYYIHSISSRCSNFLVCHKFTQSYTQFKYARGVNHMLQKLYLFLSKERIKQREQRNSVISSIIGNFYHHPNNLPPLHTVPYHHTIATTMSIM